MRLLMMRLMLVMVLLVGCTSQSATLQPTSTPTQAAATAAAQPEPTPRPTVAATPGSTAVPEPTETAVIIGDDTSPAIVAAANAFLATLSDSEKEAVLFDWSDTEQKQRWSNLPEGLYVRTGLMWGNLTEPQQTAWLDLMKVTLSPRGYDRMMAAWNGDEVLATEEGGGGGPGGQQLQFGKQFYWIAIIGTPSDTEPWQWQWGGHHVTVNATIVGPNVALTPSFIGAQPATYTDANGNIVRPLGDIEDLGFALVNALDATQQKSAVLGNTSIDVVLGPGQDGKTIQPEGLLASEMNDGQQEALIALISLYTGLVNDEDSAARLDEITSTLDQTYFAWYGPTVQGNPAYFRITGPTIVIEYSPQQMGGAASNHIHGIYRDPSNDYGAKYTK